jgi:cellulose synthase/poly-beta-1,6-N-acetylglucosamine synthase-like glycosyltransferase
VLPECVASDDGERRSVAVLIPVHNESRLIAETIRTVGPQLRSGDRLIVVADNCSDNTAVSLPALPSRTPTGLGALQARLNTIVVVDVALFSPQVTTR